MVRWLWRGVNTRYHSELGRENPQRRWYFVLRHGRVGRCRALKSQLSFDAGWSSLVARQAHNLKVAGSNPAPATKIVDLHLILFKFPDVNSNQNFLRTNLLNPLAVLILENPIPLKILSLISFMTLISANIGAS